MRRNLSNLIEPPPNQVEVDWDRAYVSESNMREGSIDLHNHSFAEIIWSRVATILAITFGPCSSHS